MNPLAEILDRLNDTCPALPTSDAERLAQIGELIYQHAILRSLPAADSDQHGPKAFKTLDKQLIRYWKRKFTPNAAPDPTWSGEGNPADIPAPHQ